MNISFNAQQEINIDLMGNVARQEINAMTKKALDDIGRQHVYYLSMLSYKGYINYMQRKIIRRSIKKIIITPLINQFYKAGNQFKITSDAFNEFGIALRRIKNK